ncbi:MAG: nucleoside phosphorylase [Chloroflexota bacterium]|nr:nucleoside phosphorylase [Chloroflexota bacterium]
MRHDYPILEHDPERSAVIEPHHARAANVTLPKRAVVCFFREVIAAVCADKHAVALHLESEMGLLPVYIVRAPQIDGGEPFAVMQGAVGAPLAAGFLEELIANGVTDIIACGGAGALDAALTVGHVVIPTGAVRDEGTSYHYLPPTRTVTPHPAGVAAIKAVLDRHQIPHVEGLTWTTDALYRETPAKVALRRAEGCITVEMEAAAFFAVAQFRGVRLAQLLYAGDDVSGETWDRRDWIKSQASVREKLFWLAAEAACAL